MMAVLVTGISREEVMGKVDKIGIWVVNKTSKFIQSIKFMVGEERERRGAKKMLLN